MDAGEHDIEQIMRWNERLRLLAQLQGTYNELLQENGFGSEESFNLVRDWSHRAWDWTFRDTAPSFPELPEMGPPREPAIADPFLNAPDPSSADPSEPYLILLDPLEDLDEGDDERWAA